MDIRIILTASFSFAIFLLFHFLVFRKIKQEEVIRWLVRVYLTAGILSCILSFVFFSSDLSLVEKLIVLMLSVSLYTLIAAIYVMGVFGIIESSIRIRLLNEIAIAGNKGITYSSLLATYNREVIIKKRLKRFLSSGELIFEKSYYRINKNFSLYFIPVLILRFIWRLYRK